MRELGAGSSSFDGDLRGKFLDLVKRSASEEDFIRFIRRTSARDGQPLDYKSLEIMLELTLAAVDQCGYVNFEYFDNETANGQSRRDQILSDESLLVNSDDRPQAAPDMSSYDGDDEELDDTFIFPCHVIFDDCHPELLTDYHREHLKPTRSPIQIIRLPKVCEFVIESVFVNLRAFLAQQQRPKLNERRYCTSETELDNTNASQSSNHGNDEHQLDKGNLSADDDANSEDSSQSSEEHRLSHSLTDQLSCVVRLIKKINKVCLSERRNCRILSRTEILGLLLENINHLIRLIPDEQYIYLEPLIRFVFTLSDYKISGSNLKLLFKIIKNEETNLNIVLRNLQTLLEHHHRILRNIQPTKSINFPTASRTPEEIEYDRYLANSWHWRLRSKVIENKRRRSRTESQSQDLKLQLNKLKQQQQQQQQQQRNGAQDGAELSVVVEETTTATTTNTTVGERLEYRSQSSLSAASSWLECSLMTPLSNVSPLIHKDGEIKFCCSLWLSVCGDLLVIENNKHGAARDQHNQHRQRHSRSNHDENDVASQIGLADWSHLSGHWLRLTSRRRLVRRRKNKLVLSLAPRKRRLSAKLRARQAYDQEDEERDELEEKARKSDAELAQGHRRSGRRLKLFHSSLRRTPRSSTNNSLDKQQDKSRGGSGSANEQHQNGSSNGSDSTPRSHWRHSQEQLIHLISFALDSLTVELWLNVKCMTFLARTCRLTREGQTVVQDSVTFRSHLKANGSWSNLILCLNEEEASGGGGGGITEMRAINLRLIVNGVREETAKLTFSAHKSPVTNFALFIGCERSTFGYVWKLSQVNLYKNIPDETVPIYLLGKGPDFWSFTNFRQQSLLPLPDITQRNMRLIVLQPEVLVKYSTIDEEQTLNWLTQNIVISYVAHQPEHFLDYSPSMGNASMGALPADYEFSNSAERFIQAKTLDFSRSIRFNHNNGFGSALAEAGGVESVLMSFAEVVRRSHATAAQTHALAFSVLLKLIQTNAYHLNKFLDELNGLKLVEYILAHPKCRVSCDMLESYLDFCLMVDEHNSSGRALIKSPKLIYHLLTSWRVWHKEAKVAKMLYRRLIRLLHTTAPQIQRRQGDLDHHYIDHNLRMMSQAGGLDILMDILRDCLISVDTTELDAPYIDHEIIDQIVHLISLLIQQPPGLDVMLDIMEFLLFLHPDPKAFVELSQDRLGFLQDLSSVQQMDQIVFDDEDDDDGGGGAQTPLSETPTGPTSDDYDDHDNSDDNELVQTPRKRADRLPTGLGGSITPSNNTLSGGSSAANRISTQCSRNLAEIMEEFNSRRPNINPPTAHWSALANQQHRQQFADQRRSSGTQKLNDGTSLGQTTRNSATSSGVCSNRNYTIARIVDMLHFITILPLSHSSSANRTLTEALSKLIIDPRKFVILANNELPMVREKVLRLFLHFIRACYKANLKSVLTSYDQETASLNYRICTPIHLMARQLLRYRTTSRMIQLCHGILGGVSDFEAADTLFTSFEIDTSDIQFQLNILVLLIQLLTRLPEPRQVVAGLRVMQAYIKQLIQINEESTVSVIIKNDLIDCLMSLYFLHVKRVINVNQPRQPNSSSSSSSSSSSVEDESDDENLAPEQEDAGTYGARDAHDAALLNELDRLLIFIVRFYLQTKSTGPLVKAIDDLLLYLELLNTRVPSQFKYLLRDRMAILFLTELKFCNHYERCARQRIYNGKFQYYLRTLLKNQNLNKFSQSLPEFEPSELELEDAADWPPVFNANQDVAQSENGVVKEDDTTMTSTTTSGVDSSGNGTSIETVTGPEMGAHHAPTEGDGLDSESFNNGITLSRSEITESNVIDRFKATFAMISSFVTTRDPEVIPSPYERIFIMKCLKILARYLIEVDLRQDTPKNRRQTTQWTVISAKLERFMRACFTRLILYLLAPSSGDGMNLDERKYFAHQILDMFQVDQLLKMLGGGSSASSSRSNHKMLLAFIRDLTDFGASQLDEMLYTNELGSPTSAAASEEELLDDTEIKLRNFIIGLESEVGGDVNRHIQGGRFDLKMGDRWWPSSGGGSPNGTAGGIGGGGVGGGGGQEEGGDQKYRAIWLEDLAKAREDLRERLEMFTGELRFGGLSGTAGGGDGGLGKQTIAGGSLENLALFTAEERDKFLDEAVSITKDVVNDKHEQRKAYLENVKQNKIYNYHIRQQWLSLIIGHTHERAIWFLEDYYPKSWELNPVEGPSRTRRRLRPCKLKLESRFLRQRKGSINKSSSSRLNKFDSKPGSSANRLSPGKRPSSKDKRQSTISDSDLDQSTSSSSSLTSDDWYTPYSPHPLCSLIINNEQSLDSNELRIRMFTTDKIHFNCDCSIIRPNEVCHGEVSIASWCIHFIGNRSEGDGNCASALVTPRNLRSQSRHQNARGPLATTAPMSVSKYNKSPARNTSSDGAVITTTVVEDLWFDEIVEIWDRRYQLQEVGLEIFLTNNMTYLLSFRNNSDREDFKQNLMREQHKMINLQRFNLTTSLSRLSQLWRDGKLTNFDYLTCLNKLAGRSFNDLMQYPVFPFIIADYTSNSLNLNEPASFRNLSRPMAIQNEDREANFRNVYQMSASSICSGGPTIMGSLGFAKPYHYGNHYSNSASVLHFLVRLPPFTHMLIEYQDNNFDQPDRTFHAMANTWQLITRDSNTDFKELIPEFFFLPEMFINIGNLELGRKQNNELVDDVKLPPWCPNLDARLFILIHRQALESAFVSEHLHHWIDLIFGYKQTGKPAVEALNVFHPATYYGGIDFSARDLRTSSSSGADSMSAVNINIATKSNFGSVVSTAGFNMANSITSGQQQSQQQPGSLTAVGSSSSAVDSSTAATKQQQQSPSHRPALNKHLQADIERSALETMIKTYGQMPRQLFSSPMKQRSASLFAHQANENQLEKRAVLSDESKMGTPANGRQAKKFEPLKQVKGLRWGSYVGSPSESDIIAVKHKRIIMEPVKDSYRIKRLEGSKKDELVIGPKLLSKQSDKFHFCLLANGDVAILRNNTSLMLDYRADRKSSGTYQLSIPSVRYSRRAGLSRVSRMNLFSNMIISRQQFSFLEPLHTPSNQFNSDAAASSPANQSSSLVATLTGGSSGRIKFSLDSLILVSWFYIDGVVRVKHPAPSNQKPSLPLVQANTIVDSMTTCCSVPELNLLLVGYRSGAICAHIVSTAYETVPIQRSSTTSMPTILSAGPSAVHFLNTTSSGSPTMEAQLLGPGRVSTDKATSAGGAPYSPVSLAGKTLQSVRSMNRTTRWLYCHDRQINCIKINVSFGIVVTGSDDGTSVIWDLNSLTFVRTIDYKMSSLRMRRQQEEDGLRETTGGSQTNVTPKSNKSGNKNFHSWTYGRSHKQILRDYLCTCDQSSNSDSHDDDEGISTSGSQQLLDEHDDELHTSRHSRPCFICGSGVSLIAISDTLGDIVTIKHLNSRLAAASDPIIATPTSTQHHQQSSTSDAPRNATSGADVSATSATSLISSQQNESNSSSSESSLTSVIYVHTINGALVNFANCHAHVTAVNYSNAPEGLSINVIVVGMVDGLIRLYSSWDLSRVKEFRVSGLESPISDIMYTRASQLLYVAYEDGQMVVLRSKKKGSVGLPKEWIL